MIVPAFLLRLMQVPKLGRTLKLGPEDLVCIEFSNRLRAWTLEGRLGAVWSHIPNEVGGGRGRASEIAYAIAKAIGLIPGTPDYFFVWAGGGCVIEAKSKSGRLSDNQKDFAQWCALRGIQHRVIRSADEGEAVLREMGVLRG